MDWTFLLVVGAVLFALILGVLAIRHYLMLRLERIRREEQLKEDARVTAESNSGL